MNDLERSRADEIRSLHTEIGTYCHMALARAIRVGELLTDQKAAMPHGDFGRWIQEHLPFSDRTARNYMKLYEHRDRLKTETVSELNSAYRLLRQPKQLQLLDTVDVVTGVAADLPAEAQETILEDAASHQWTGRQIAEEVERLRPKRLPAIRQCNGMQYAKMAIVQLEKISRKDEQRKEALDIVAKWVKENR